MSKSSYALFAGIIIGILIAPDKGSRTRNRLSRRAQSLKDKFSSKDYGGYPVAPMGRDSGLSSQISPEITDIL